MHIGVLVVEIQRALPAIDRLVVQLASLKATPHRVKAIRALLLVQSGEVEHFLGLLVIAQFRVGGDAIAIGRLISRIKRLDPLEALNGILETTDAGQIHTKVIKSFEVIGLENECFLVGFDGFAETLHFIEGKSDVEEPGAVVGIDRNGGAEKLEGLGPLLLLEELLGLFDLLFGVVPVVHGLPIRRSVGPHSTARVARRNARRARAIELPPTGNLIL